MKTRYQHFKLLGAHEFKDFISDHSHDEFLSVAPIEYLSTNDGRLVATQYVLLYRSDNPYD